VIPADIRPDETLAECSDGRVIFTREAQALNYDPQMGVTPFRNKRELAAHITTIRRNPEWTVHEERVFTWFGVMG
jgi:hypothetical protein